MAVDTQELVRVLEAGPLPCYEVARRLGRRKADVLAALIAEPELFERTGKGRSSKWRLKTAHPELSVHELLGRGDAARKLIAAGAVPPLEGLEMVVWPTHSLLLADAAGERRAA